MTDPAPTHTGGARNPGPRPALQRRTADDTVITARPRAGTAPATAHSLAPPTAGTTPDGGATQTQKDKDRSKDDKAKAKLKAGRDARAGKDGKKHKDGHHKDGKSARSGKDGPHPADKDPARDERELVVVLPKAVRRALGDAAVEHGTTPERLVALVLSEWLDH